MTTGLSLKELRDQEIDLLKTKSYEEIAETINILNFRLKVVEGMVSDKQKVIDYYSGLHDGLLEKLERLEKQKA